MALRCTLLLGESSLQLSIRLIDSKNYNSWFTESFVMRLKKALNWGVIHNSHITFPIFSTILLQHDILSRKIEAYQRTQVFVKQQCTHLIRDDHHILMYWKRSVSGSLYFNPIEWRGIASFQTFQYFPHFVRIGNDCNYFYYWRLRCPWHLRHFINAFFTYTV